MRRNARPPRPRKMILSIQQPWAWAIVNGWKPVENRTWRSTYAGPLLIHAGRRELKDDLADVLDAVAEQTGRSPADLLVQYQRQRALGAIVGKAMMRGCVDRSRTAAALLGKPAGDNVERWWQGPYGFVLDRGEVWDPPVPLRGRLGIWFMDAVELQVAIERAGPPRSVDNPIPA